MTVIINFFLGAVFLVAAIYYIARLVESLDCDMGEAKKTDFPDFRTLVAAIEKGAEKDEKMDALEGEDVEDGVDGGEGKSSFVLPKHNSSGAGYMHCGTSYTGRCTPGVVELAGLHENDSVGSVVSSKGSDDEDDEDEDSYGGFNYNSAASSNMSNMCAAAVVSAISCMH